MAVTTYQEYEIYPQPREIEKKRAKELIKIAFSELENESSLTSEEIIKEFEELRKDIINQCKINGTL